MLLKLFNKVGMYETSNYVSYDISIRLCNKRTYNRSTVTVQGEFEKNKQNLLTSSVYIRTYVHSYMNTMKSPVVKNNIHMPNISTNNKPLYSW